jgi:hypothetical protein
VVDVWERLAATPQADRCVLHMGSDQTSLHNPYNGGYYPVGKCATTLARSFDAAILPLLLLLLPLLLLLLSLLLLLLLLLLLFLLPPHTDIQVKSY